MRFVIKTRVSQPISQVFANFNEILFRKLAPPFLPIKLLRFDGCKKGDIVSLELNFILFRQIWTSYITDFQSRAEEIFFIDEGKQLPFFLKSWKHVHRIQAVAYQPMQSYIIDDITFQSPYRWLDLLLLPVLYLQFAYRKPIYKRLFKANQTKILK
ncbi:MAG: hypothetical protein NZ551_11445 [Microscillaceae bacterium]|nr:hypothetical protein [Microscillaceae bacterium]MDW8461808.1 hypothetical protein [Cytophagales bacterium]